MPEPESFPVSAEPRCEDDERRVSAEPPPDPLREALEEIKRDCGRVCADFMGCTHASCQSSYTAWAIADKVLADQSQSDRTSDEATAAERLTHEWYWGNGQPCCVNCGTFARCEDAENTVARYIDAEARVEALEAQRDEALKALERLWECADWYARCLEDVQDGRSVRGLDEAKAGHTNAVAEARRILSGERERMSDE